MQTANRLIALSFISAGLLIALNARAEDEWERAKKITKNANAWREGDEIPEELRRYVPPRHLGNPLSTGELIAGITNLPLLTALAVEVTADPENREDALIQGMYALGPTRYFELLRSRIDVASSLSTPWIQELKERMKRPHVVVDALFIDDDDMSREEVSAVFDQISADLKQGMAWPKMYELYSGQYGYNTGNRTKIGNLGHFILFPDPALGTGRVIEISGGATSWEGETYPERLAALTNFDATHLPALLKANVGDVVQLHSESRGWAVLYAVHEIYNGTQSPKP